ncbi:TPA: prepilin peptidase [Yersinia enterocolitica]
MSPLSYKYNILILGWFYPQTVAQCCNQRINLRYITVEALTVILTLITMLFFFEMIILVLSDISFGSYCSGFY